MADINRITGETFRDRLLDRMIKLYGSGSPNVIAFVKLCQRWDDNDQNNKYLEIVVRSHEEFPHRYEEEE